MRTIAELGPRGNDGNSTGTGLDRIRQGDRREHRFDQDWRDHVLLLGDEDVGERPSRRPCRGRQRDQVAVGLGRIDRCHRQRRIRMNPGGQQAGPVQRAFDRSGGAGVHPRTEIRQLPERCPGSFGPMGRPEIGSRRPVVTLARYGCPLLGQPRRSVGEVRPARPEPLAPGGQGMPALGGQRTEQFGQARRVRFTDPVQPRQEQFSLVGGDRGVRFVAGPPARPGFQLPGQVHAGNGQPVIGLAAGRLAGLRQLPRRAERALRADPVPLRVADVGEMVADLPDVIAAGRGPRLRRDRQVLTSISR